MPNRSDDGTVIAVSDANKLWLHPHGNQTEVSFAMVEINGENFLILRDDMLKVIKHSAALLKVCPSNKKGWKGTDRHEKILKFKEPAEKVLNKFNLGVDEHAE